MKNLQNISLSNLEDCIKKFQTKPIYIEYKYRIEDIENCI